MALGEAIAEVTAGGGQQRASAAKVARTVIQIGVSPKGTPATVYSPASLGGLLSALDTGPLLEAAAMRHRQGLTAYVVPVDPTVAGDLSTVSHVGSGAGSISVAAGPHRLIEVICSTGGTLTTAAFRFRVGGTGAYSEPVTSGSATWAYRVPGTFTVLSFPAATYVATKTLTVSTDGTVTQGSGWAGSVTQASSPIDNYDVVCTIMNDVSSGESGDLQLQVSLDGGKTAMSILSVPSTGDLVVPGTGLIITATAAAFVTGETYSFLACPPSYSSGDLDDCLDAIRADPTIRAALVHLIGLPATASAAISQASTLDAAIIAAKNAGESDWQGLCECPYVDDTVVYSGAAIADTADDEDEIRDQREGQDLIYTALCAATHRMTSSLDGRKLKRPTGWALAARFCDTDPKDDLSEVAAGPLPIFEVGRDEAEASTALEDVQINVIRKYRGRNGGYLAISSGGFGFKNLTTQENFQDAGGIRMLNAGLNVIRIVGQSFLGKRPKTNADGTIEEGVRRAWTSQVDGEIKRALGMKAGGDFSRPQASFAAAEVLASSQLGTTPHRLDIEYDLQALGFVSDVSSAVRYSGVLTLE